MHIDALVRSVVCRRPGTAVLADRHLHPPPPNLLAAFWPANAVLLGCMVRYPRLATPAGWAGGILGFFLVHRGFPGKAALIFRKKYSESLNPYAMRFITLILLFTPSSTLVCIG